MIGLGLAGDLTPRPLSISPSSLSFLSAFHSASLWLWGFFFFFAAIWVDLILVSNCGGWFVVEVLLRQWILVAGGCAVDVVAVVDDNGRGDNILF